MQMQVTMGLATLSLGAVGLQVFNKE